VSYISSYIIDIKPPVYPIGTLYTSFPLLSIRILYNNVAPTKIIKIMVDKSPYRVYNINRCTLKGHTYTLAYTYAQRVITKLHQFIREFLGFPLNSTIY